MSPGVHCQRTTQGRALEDTREEVEKYSLANKSAHTASHTQISNHLSANFFVARCCRDKRAELSLYLGSMSVFIRMCSCFSPDQELKAKARDTIVIVI